MRLEKTNHNYYCNDSNYFGSGSYSEYDTWQEFKADWFISDGRIDHDYNHCFRFDIDNIYDSETGAVCEGRYSLHLYMMLQRKGWFKPVMVKEIYESDMKEVEQYLGECWEYLKQQWAEFSANNQ